MILFNVIIISDNAAVGLMIQPPFQVYVLSNGKVDLTFGRYWNDIMLSLLLLFEIDMLLIKK